MCCSRRISRHRRSTVSINWVGNMNFNSTQYGSHDRDNYVTTMICETRRGTPGDEQFEDDDDDMDNNDCRHGDGRFTYDEHVQNDSQPFDHGSGALTNKLSRGAGIVCW